MLLTFFLLLFWNAPLGVLIAKRIYQSPEWTILSHVNCFIQGEVIGFPVFVDSLIHVVRAYEGILVVSFSSPAVKIFLASVSSGIRAM